MIMYHLCQMRSAKKKKKFLQAISNLPRRTPICDLHVAFRIAYLYDYGTKLCR